MKRIVRLALLAAVPLLLLSACESGAGGGTPVYHRPSTGQGQR